MRTANWRTAVMFGVCVGCFVSTWIAAINPLAPFAMAVVLAPIVLWRAGNEHAEQRKGTPK